jgi:hypothetical protein
MCPLDAAEFIENWGCRSAALHGPRNISRKILI